MPYKISFITNLACPTSTKQVWSFVGLVNYYKDMWLKRAHFLAPLTDLCSARKMFLWIDSHEHSLQQIKQRPVVAEAVMLRFPDYSQPFSMYTDKFN